MIRRLSSLALFASLFSSAVLAADAVPHAAESSAKQESETGITHSFISFGETYIVGEDSKVSRTYSAGSRDGWVLPGGNLLIAVSKSKEYPHGGAIEVNSNNKIIWKYEGTQSEVNTVQAVGEGRYMVTEAGDKPRILEIDNDGKIVLEVPIQAQTKNHHLQTRMTRKLANGNYLVPQLLDKVVREYSSDGKIVWEAKTPADVKEDWPFTAIRLPDGDTLCDLTHSAMVVRFNKAGDVVWKLTNADLPSPMLADPCGAHLLPNGNLVIASYGQTKPGAVKLLEVTPDKKVVWTYTDDKKHGIHEVQILTTNGKPIEGVLTR